MFNISEQISENDLFDILGFDDLKTINESRECISASYTTGTGTPSEINKKYNTICQSKLANLTARIFDTWKSVSLKASRLEGELLEDGVTSGYKTERERESVLLNYSNDLYDLRHQSNRLEALYNFCVSLNWSLTSSLKVN